MPGERPQSGVQGDAAFFGLAREREFLTNHCIVSPKIREVAASFDGRLGQSQIQEVGNRGEGGVVTFHEMGRGSFTGSVQGDSLHFLIAVDVVDAGSDFAGTVLIASASVTDCTSCWRAMS